MKEKNIDYKICVTGKVGLIDIEPDLLIDVFLCKKNDEVPYARYSFDKGNVCFLALHKNKIVGLLCFSYKESYWGNADPKDECQWAILNVGVDPKYCNMGICKNLIKNMFEFCLKNNIHAVSQSSYSEFSSEFLPQLFEKFAKKHKSIKFIDKKTIM